MTKPLPFILCSVTMQSRLCALQPGESTAGSLDNTYNNSRYSCTLRKVITRQVWTRWVRRVRPPVSGWPGSLGSSGSPGLDSPDLGSSGTGFTGFGLTGVCYIFTYLYIYIFIFRCTGDSPSETDYLFLKRLCQLLVGIGSQLTTLMVSNQRELTEMLSSLLQLESVARTFSVMVFSVNQWHRHLVFSACRWESL